MSEKYRYAEVSIGLNPNWKNHLYTYRIPSGLQVGSLVTVPFGKEKKLGIIRSYVQKPNFSVKECISSTLFALPQKTMKLLDWLETYYPFSKGVHTQHFLPKNSTIPLLVKTLGQVKSAQVSQLTALPPLTKLQEKACLEINACSKIILHGVTGAGKTRIYMEQIQQVLDSGKNVVLLYPEIALSTQLQSVLEAHFGKEKVHTYHSQLTPTEQRNTWLAAIHNKSAAIYCGPRSALFLPIDTIGLVIVDEAHDAAYKQDSGIRYNALVVAAALANLHKARLIIGSATPPVQETHQLLAKGAQLVCVHEVAITTNSAEKNFSIVPLHKTENRFRSPLLSKQLLEAITSALSQKKQTLLFLNKRGTARLLLCDSCGWHANCSDCELPLTYHHDTYTMRCHICGRQSSVPIRCPECGQEVSQKSFGVKAIESELRSIFPHARIKRFDSDTKKADSFAQQYASIAQGDVDILIGTQLITKGLDLPKLSLVGILSADSALLLPDYTSEERAFQQLTQVSGRVGRGHGTSRVVIQTYQPKNTLLSLVINQDWHTFYEQELQKRSHAHYPPYCYSLKIWVLRSSEKTAKTVAKSIENTIREKFSVKILGPAPAFYEKIGKQYQWQLVITSSSRRVLLDIVQQLPNNTHFDIDPVSLL